MSEIELPEPAAWREDDGHWIYYDETNNPKVFEHIAKYQKDRHDKEVFALFTAEQVRQLLAAERERCACIAEETVVAEYEGVDCYGDKAAEAIRRGSV